MRRAFLESIRQWGKKVIIVINKVDILKSPEAADEIRTFVRDQVKRLLDFEPAMFMVSAGITWKGSQIPGMHFRVYRAHGISALGENMIRLKLLNPLGVSQKVARQYEAIANDRLSILHADLESLKKVEANLNQFRMIPRRNLAGNSTGLIKRSCRCSCAARNSSTTACG